MNAQWYERWLILREARNSQAAYQAAKHYDDLTQAPSDIREAMMWAIERE